MIGWLVVLRIASPADIFNPILHFAPLLRHPVCPFSVNERHTRHVATKKCYVWLASVLSRTVAGLLGLAIGGSTWRPGHRAIVAEGKHALAGRLARVSGAPRRCTAMTGSGPAGLGSTPRFGFPCDYAIWHFANRRRIWTILGYPTYGGGPLGSVGIKTSVPLLVSANVRGGVDRRVDAVAEGARWARVCVGAAADRVNVLDWVSSATRTAGRAGAHPLGADGLVTGTLAAPGLATGTRPLP
jgi:hypothetical protein